ncbi:hypothetical protein [Paragemmobacter aquarius]|nr:hypothetical protein [Gemmobacter aquarius]
MMRVTEFLDDPRGTMTYTGLVFLLLTVLVGGVAVDVMRHEGTRSQVQKALDGCTSTVAAVATVQKPADESASDAAVRNTARNATMTTLVNDCMTRAGLSTALTSVTATSAAGYASLATTAGGTQSNFFMNMLNIGRTDYNVASTAALPPAGKVEVILAYESSNAMSVVDPITGINLSTPFRTGANAFVDTLMATDVNNAAGTRPATTVSLLPYTNGVNLPTGLMSRYSVTNVSNLANANCIDIPTTDFSAAAMSTATAYQTMVPADLATTTSTVITYLPSNSTVAATNIPSSAGCPAYPNNILRMPTTSASTLKSNITSAQFFGGLRWDHGMHWANALLHPGTNIGSIVTPVTTAYPSAYNTADVQKVIVFVNTNGSGSNPTDGSQLMLANAFASGTSPIWRNSATPALYCIQLTARPSNQFYRPDTNTWSTACPGTYTRLTWPQVWASVRVQWVAWQLYARGIQTSSSATLAQVRASFDAIWPTMQQSLPFTTQASQFQSECTAAKANGVVIYTVGLAAIARAKDPLRACASSPAHYFDTTSATFPDVMRLIAQTINQQAYTQ